VGDAALRTVARLLRDGCRGSDVVGRYGGEEFLLILVETTPAQARTLCDKLRQRIARHDWAALHSGLGPLTVSIGLAGLDGDGPVDELLACADRQLYRAKHGGRDRVCG
jgi:diguanylate cyclase (GGDEF)-like protein